jgi:hypothetical protein
MQLGNCPVDPVLRYTDPPAVQTHAAASGSSTPTVYFPYAEMERLRGLRGLGATAPRWGLVLFAGLGVFATMLLLLRRKRR